MRFLPAVGKNLPTLESRTSLNGSGVCFFEWLPCAWSGLVRHVAKHRESQTMESLLTVWVQECLYTVSTSFREFLWWLVAGWS